MAGKYWSQPIFSTTWTGMEAWIDNARRMKIDSFYVLNLDTCSSEPLNIIAQNHLTNPTGVIATLYRAPDYKPEPFIRPEYLPYQKDFR
jgi:hypothetical protein